MASGRPSLSRSSSTSMLPPVRGAMTPKRGNNSGRNNQLRSSFSAGMLIPGEARKMHPLFQTTNMRMMGTPKKTRANDDLRKHGGARSAMFSAGFPAQYKDTSMAALKREKKAIRKKAIAAKERLEHLQELRDTYEEKRVARKIERERRRKEYFEQKKAATVIQNRMRGHLARKRVEAIKADNFQRNWAATKLQAVWRGGHDREKARKKRKEYTGAAMAIQGRFRSFVSIRGAKEVIEVLREEREVERQRQFDQYLAECATSIQCIFRGKQGRGKFLKERAKQNTIKQAMQEKERQLRASLEEEAMRRQVTRNKDGSLKGDDDIPESLKKINKKKAQQKKKQTKKTSSRAKSRGKSSSRRKSTRGNSPKKGRGRTGH